MTTARNHSRARMLLRCAGGGLVLQAAMLGSAVLSAPPASAGCTMTSADDQYIHLLAQNKMVHTADFNDCNMAAEGRWFADQARKSDDPYGTAKGLVKMVTDTTPMNPKQAEWEVESAIYVYAPQMIPKIKDEAAQSPG
jgi:hypothetical protein